jgi:hypothetical protein
MRMILLFVITIQYLPNAVTFSSTDIPEIRKAGKAVSDVQ